MKKIISILLLFGFMLLSGWEMIPKFYETATRKIAEPLFVASTKKYENNEKTHEIGNNKQKIDYKKLTSDINTDGA
jgi:F0F1-type ATP synthase membrane subunit b/b'